MTFSTRMECRNGEVSYSSRTPPNMWTQKKNIEHLTLGTGYYYSRFRPGLGSVMIFLVLLTCTVQHGVAHINRQRDLQRISRLSKQAKSIAYGPKGVPFEKGVKRKVRVPLSVPDTSSEDMDNNRSSTGRMIDLMVDGTDVYVVSLPGSSSSRRYSSHIALRLLTHTPPKNRLVVMGKHC